MALFNYATKEITLKIVYYGPGLSGKTTNLQHLHAVLNPETKGKLLSLSTESDRTLFFDFLPVELGKIREFSIRFQLYTVPGQVRYNATRKVVLKGADAIVFVADSQEDMRDQNIESFENMRENLISNNINPDTIPIILQFNKRDLKNIMGIEALNQNLNRKGTYEVLEAVAIEGKGVEETFKKITKLLLKDISRKHKIEIHPPAEMKKSVSPIKPVLETKSEPVKQDIYPEQKPFKRTISEPEIPQISAIGSPVVIPDKEEITLTSEQEMRESGPVENVEPVRVSAVPEPAPDAGPALPEFTEESMFPEQVIRESGPVENVEPVRVSAVPEPAPDAGPALPEFTEESMIPEYEIDDAELIEELDSAKEIEIPNTIPDAVPAFPELAKETVVPEPEERVEQPIPTFPEPAEIEPAREIPRDTRRSFSTKKTEEFSDTVREISEKMVSMSETITLLRHTISDLRSEVKALQYNLMPKKEQREKVSDFKDSNEFKELKREQKEIADLNRHILYMLNSIKEKKSWFRFF